MAERVPPQGPMTNLLSLPDDILFSILDNLSSRDVASAAQTCHKLRNTVNHPYFWSRRRVRLHLDVMNRAILRSLCQRRVRIVQVLSCRHLRQLARLLDVVPSIRTLDLSSLPPLTNADVKTVFFKDLPNMNHLSLSLADGFLSMSICKRLRNLRVLKLFRVTEFNFQHMVGSFPQLRKLKVEKDANFFFDLNTTVFAEIRRPQLQHLCFGNIEVEVEDMKNLSKGLTNLQSLCIRVCSREPQYSELIHSLARMSSLKELRLKCYQLGGERMQALSKGFPNLKVFHFHSSVDMTETEGVSIGQMKNLEELVLGNATDSALMCISQGLKSHLKRFCFHGRRVTISGIGSVATMTGLQKLFLHCRHITHESFRLLQNLTGLTSLEVCDSAHEFSLQSAAHIAAMKSLRDLRLQRLLLEPGCMQALCDGAAPLVSINACLCQSASVEEFRTTKAGCKFTENYDPLFSLECSL